MSILSLNLTNKSDEKQPVSHTYKHNLQCFHVILQCNVLSSIHVADINQISSKRNGQNISWGLHLLEKWDFKHQYMCIFHKISFSLYINNFFHCYI